MILYARDGVELPVGLQEINSPLIEICRVPNAEGLSDALYLNEEGLVLLLPPPQTPLVINFFQPSCQRALKDPPGKGSLLGKSLGVHKGFNRVIDGTAGFGSDLWLFHAMGLKAIGIERIPEIWLLLKWALTTYEIGSQTRPFDIKFGEARSLLPQVQSQFQAEVIYFDFLFSQGKKGRSRKSMESLHRLTSPDSFEEEMELIALSLSLEPQPRRVTVKRPLRWRGTSQYKPRHSYEGNGIRYDVF